MVKEKLAARSATRASAPKPIAICCLVRNEAAYLAEWVVFHRRQGVDRFFVVDDNSYDSTSDVIDSMHELGVEKLDRSAVTGEQDFAGVSPRLTEPGVRDQIAFTSGCIRHARQRLGDSTWVLNVDIDEFLVPPGDAGDDSSVAEELWKLQEQQTIPVGQILLQRLLVGSNGYTFQDSGPVTQRFNARMGFTSTKAYCDPHGPLVRLANRTKRDAVLFFKFCANYASYQYGKYGVLTDAVAKVPETWTTVLRPNFTSVQCLHPETTSVGCSQETLVDGVFQSKTCGGCGLAIYHYQLKSTAEFMQRTRDGVWAAKYMGSQDAWFRMFDQNANEVCDSRAAQLLGDWTDSPSAKNSELQKLYGPVTAASLERSIRLRGHNISSAVLLLGMHHSGTSMATRLLMLLGIYSGEQSSDFHLLAGNPWKYWERRDVVTANQLLFDAQSRRSQLNSSHPDKSAVWLGKNFKVENAEPAELGEFAARAGGVVSRLGGRGAPIWVTKDPRLCLTAKIWLPLIQQYQKQVTIVIMWRNPLDIANAMSLHWICTGTYGRDKNGTGVCQGKLTHLQLVETSVRYTYSSLHAAVGYPTVLWQHPSLASPAEFIRKAKKSLQGAGVSEWPEFAREPFGNGSFLANLTGDINKDYFAAAHGGNNNLPGWRMRFNLRTIAIIHVMTLAAGWAAKPLPGKKVPRDCPNWKGLCKLAAATPRAERRAQLLLDVVEDTHKSLKELSQQQASLAKWGVLEHNLKFAFTDVEKPSSYVGLVFLAWTTSISGFGEQQVAVIESIFFHNPNAKVRIASNSLRLGFLNGRPPALLRLAEMGYDLDIWPFPDGAIKSILSRTYDKRHSSAYSHATDVYRYWILHKYGGIYMDFDVVVTNPWVAIPLNFMHYQYDAQWGPPKGSNGAKIWDPKKESTWTLNSAFMGFNAGHPLLAHLLSTVGAAHDPNNWASVGNEFIMKQLKLLKLEDASAPGSNVSKLLNFVMLQMPSVSPLPWHLTSCLADVTDAECIARCQTNFKAGFAFHLYSRGLLLRQKSKEKLEAVGEKASFQKGEKGSCIYTALTSYRI